MNRPNGKKCAAPGSPPPSLPFLTLSLTRVLFTKHFHRGKNQAVPFSQGSAFLLFNTVHVFSISVERRLSDLPKPSESRCLGVSEDIGKAHKQQQQWRQRDRGGSSWKTSRRWSPSRRSRRQASLFHFPRRIYWVKFGGALERHQNYSSPSVNVGGEGWRGSHGLGMERCLEVCHFLLFLSVYVVYVCGGVRASGQVFLQCNTTWQICWIAQVYLKVFVVMPKCWSKYSEPCGWRRLNTIHCVSNVSNSRGESEYHCVMVSQDKHLSLSCNVVKL